MNWGFSLLEWNIFIFRDTRPELVFHSSLMAWCGNGSVSYPSEMYWPFLSLFPMEMVALNLKLKEVIVGCVVAKGISNLGISCFTILQQRVILQCYLLLTGFRTHTDRYVTRELVRNKYNWDGANFLFSFSWNKLWFTSKGILKEILNSSYNHSFCFLMVHLCVCVCFFMIWGIGIVLLHWNFVTDTFKYNYSLFWTLCL